MEKNKDVYLNFGLIAYGPLREIEKLQQLVTEQCKQLRVVYQTVSAKRLKLVKLRDYPAPVFGSKTTFTGGSQHE
ncbi:MAG: hypothetical protein QXL54_04590 [Candidatus Bathyarchaeia archaeon]